MDNMKKKAEIHLLPSHVKTYRFIEKYIQKNIVAPEINEISLGIHMSIRQTYRALSDLQKLELISRSQHKTRSIVILKPLV